MKGILQQAGKKGKTIIAQLLKADVTIGELEKQREVYPLTFKEKANDL